MSTNAPAGDLRGYCRECGKPLTSETVRGVRGVLYCEDCLATRVSVPPAGRSEAGAPALAGFLGIIPGLGAVYNGEYVKALVHVLIFAGLIATLDSGELNGMEPFFGIALAAFCVYMPIEAYKTARAKAEGRATGGVLGQKSNAPIGPLLLIGVGVLFLLHQFVWFDLGRIFRFGWPLVLIVIGGWMLWSRANRNS